MFGPTLLRTSESPATLSSVVDTKEQVRVVELMAKYAWDIFGPEANLMPRDYDHRPVKHKHKREHSPRLDELLEDHRTGNWRSQNIFNLHFNQTLYCYEGS